MNTLSKVQEALEALGSAPGSWWSDDAPYTQDAVDFAREYLESCFAHDCDTNKEGN